MKVGVVGATGYTGIELVRLLHVHPRVTITHLFSKQSEGRSFQSVFPHVPDALDLVLQAFDPYAPPEVDVLFLALPHGDSHRFLPSLIAKGIKIIDLSADFRLDDPNIFEQFYGVQHANPGLLKTIPYGLPELYRDEISKATAVANPGCYTTASILGLYPLIENDLVVGTPFIDGKSGVTGAGKSLKESSLYCEVNEHISAYATATHRHTPEIEMELGRRVFFSPHLIPMNRGILCSCYVTLAADLTVDEVLALYTRRYQNEPFVRVFGPDVPVTTRYVLGSNVCGIFVRPLPGGRQWAIFSVIDNLIKGASGQAVQNMNLMCGFEETLGLTAIATPI